MKVKWIVLAAAAAMTASTSLAGGGVNIGVYIGGPAPVYAVPVPVYVQPAPVYVQPRPVVVRGPRGVAVPRGYRGPRYVAAPARVWVPGYYVNGSGKGNGHNKRWVAGYWRYR